MNAAEVQSHKFEAMTWGALLIWWGITEMAQFLPTGTGAIGIGLILLGSNAVRSLNGIPASRFSTTLGILALVWGGLELAGVALALPFELPVFAILLVVLGVIVLAHELTVSRNQSTGGLK